MLVFMAQMFLQLLSLFMCVGVVGVLPRGVLCALVVLALVVEMVEVFLVLELGKLGLALGVMASPVPSNW